MNSATIQQDWKEECLKYIHEKCSQQHLVAIFEEKHPKSVLTDVSNCAFTLTILVKGSQAWMRHTFFSASMSIIFVKKKKKRTRNNAGAVAVMSKAMASLPSKNSFGYSSFPLCCQNLIRFDVINSFLNQLVQYFNYSQKCNGF